jgi:hypothetical protein
LMLALKSCIHSLSRTFLSAYDALVPISSTTSNEYIACIAVQA